MKPSKIVKEELYGPSGIKILGTIIVYMIAGFGMLAVILWLGIVLKSFVLACIAFIVGTIVFCKLLNEVYYLKHPEERPESAMDLAKRYEEAIDRQAREEEMEEDRIEYEEAKKREKEKCRIRDIGDTNKQNGRNVGDLRNKPK